MRAFSLEERAAYEAIVAVPTPQDLGRIGHRVTQSRDDVKAWLTWELAESRWRARRRGQFASLTRFRLRLATCQEPGALQRMG